MKRFHDIAGIEPSHSTLEASAPTAARPVERDGEERGDEVLTLPVSSVVVACHSMIR